MDDEGRVIKSRGYLAETPEFFARSRFDYIDTFMEEYTAENLEALLVEAVRRQEEKDGIAAISFEEQKEMHSTELDYDELIQNIKEQYLRLSEIGKLDDYQEIVEGELGVGAVVSEATKKQVQSLDLILFNLRQVQ